MANSEEVSIEEMLKRCGAPPELIRRLATDPQYAERVVKFMGMASRHPVIYASSMRPDHFKARPFVERDPTDWLVP